MVSPPVTWWCHHQYSMGGHFSYGPVLQTRAWFGNEERFYHAINREAARIICFTLLSNHISKRWTGWVGILSFVVGIFGPLEVGGLSSKCSLLHVVYTLHRTTFHVLLKISCFTLMFGEECVSLKLFLRESLIECFFTKYYSWSLTF